MRVTARPGNRRASAVHTNVPALHDDADFYGDVSASLKICGSGFCYNPPPFRNPRFKPEALPARASCVGAVADAAGLLFGWRVSGGVAALNGRASAFRSARRYR